MTQRSGRFLIIPARAIDDPRRLFDFCSRKELIAQTEAGSNQRDRVMTAAIDHAINSEKSKSSELPEQSGDSAIPRDSTA